jgi:hypothetical protein
VRDFIERRLNRSYVQFICILVLAVYLILLTVAFATNVKGKTIFGPYLGADFGAYYIAGKIFNEHGPQRIYDAALHNQLYLTEFPWAPRDSQLYYANAPFFITPFTVLARLPYAWAYLCWLLFSLLLYLAGFSLVWKALPEIPRDAWRVGVLLALSFMPFLVECLAGGQTSAVGFFCLALAITLERRGNYFLSGLALSLCAYKPTLLLLVVPMLLITGRYVTLVGFAAGAALLSLISLLLVGWQGGVGFINTLLYFTSASTTAASGLRSWKYVDINSFFRLLVVGGTSLRWILTALVFLAVTPFLVMRWWKSDLKDSADSNLVWAMTLAWTPALNLYMGMYDATVVVLSAMLATDFLYRESANPKTALSFNYKLLLLLLYIVPWVTQPIARLAHLQLFTLVLALFGGYLILRPKRLPYHA